MNKRDKIDYILGLVKEQTEEFIAVEETNGEMLSAEEMIVAAIEVVTSQLVTTIEYSSPLAEVDRDNVRYPWTEFQIDEETSIKIMGEDDDTD